MCFSSPKINCLEKYFLYKLLSLNFTVTLKNLLKKLNFEFFRIELIRKHIHTPTNLLAGNALYYHRFGVTRKIVLNKNSSVAVVESDTRKLGNDWPSAHMMMHTRRRICDGDWALPPLHTQCIAHCIKRSIFVPKLTNHFDSFQLKEIRHQNWLFF